MLECMWCNNEAWCNHYTWNEYAKTINECKACKQPINTNLYQDKPIIICSNCPYKHENVHYTIKNIK